jgi:hypothetical protein
LSGLVDNAISHDPVTWFLSQQDFTSKELGKVIKKTVREIETGEGVLIFDDTLQEKPHSAVKTSLNGVMPWQIAGFLPLKI